MFPCQRVRGIPRAEVLKEKSELQNAKIEYLMEKV
jgi:hypothetical protein